MGVVVFSLVVSYLRFVPDAEAELHRLAEDPRLSVLYEKLNDILDLLEDNPGDRKVRRRSFELIDSWGFNVYGSGEELLVIWSRPGESPDVILVRYIGDDL